jgi:hypothetical protein
LPRMSPEVAQTGGKRSGRECPLCPGISDINLFRYRQRIIYFDAEISDRAFNLGMPEQELDGPEISRPPIDQGSLCAAQRMRPEQSRVQSDAADPIRNEARILPGGQAAARSAMAGKQELAGPLVGGLR